ncbi:MAG: hypothetical protein AAF591_11735 [Verrucomicrobiota bacterium]
MGTKGQECLARWWPGVALAGVVLALYAPVFWGGRTVMPLVERAELELHPEQGPTAPQPDARLSIDPGGGMMSSFTWDAYAVSVYQGGGVPLWNPYNGLGQPLLQNGLSAAVHPTKLAMLILPAAYWDWVFLATWWLCGWFVYLWARVLGANRIEGFLAGVVIVTSSYFALFLLLREVVLTCAGIPLLFYGIERALREPNWRWRHAVLGAGLYTLVTGGQASTILVLISVLAIFLPLRLWGGRGGFWKGVWVLFPGILAGVLMSAPHWLNFADHAFGESFSSRDVAPDMGMSAWSLRWAGGLVFPWLAGRLFENPFDSVEGWLWDMYPGWFSGVPLFLAVGGLIGLAIYRPALREGNRGVLALMAVLAIFIMLKVLGIPPVSYLGKLPLFSMAAWTRYATPVAVFFIAVATPFLFRWLWRQSTGFWCGIFAAWVAAILVMALWSYRIPMGDAAAAGAESEETEHVRVFLTGGLIWTLLPAACLFLFRMLRVSSAGAISVAVFGLIFQAVAMAPFGYEIETYGPLGWWAAGLFVGFSLVVGVADRFSRWIPEGIPARAVVYGAVLLAGGWLTLSVNARAEKSLPRRFDPLATAAYVDVLREGQEGGRYRHFAVEGAPGPNFGLPQYLSSINVMDCLVMYWGARFMDSCIDPGARPFWFAGDHTLGREGTVFGYMEQLRPWHEFCAIRYYPARGAYPGEVWEQNWVPGEPRGRKRLRVGEVIEQELAIPEGGLGRVDLYLSDDHESSPGVLMLEVRDGGGGLLGSIRERADRVADRAFHPFVFEEALDVEAGEVVTLRVWYEPPSEGPKGETVAYYEPRTEGKGTMIYRLPNMETVRLDAVFESEAGNLTIWENEGAKERVFRVPDFEVDADREAVIERLPSMRREALFGRVFLDREPAGKSEGVEEGGEDELLEFELEPNELSFRYLARGPGVLVVSDAYHRDWRATVNGVEAEVLRVNAAFRGVYVPEAGEYAVRMWYRPRTWRASLLMAGAGGLLVVMGTIRGRERHN